MLPLHIFVVSDTRTGSTAICDALAAALGVPSLGEVFYAVGAGDFGGDVRLWVTKRLMAIKPHAGFVAKVMYHDLLMGQGETFRLGGRPYVLGQMEQLFPQAILIHLTRQDFVAGAYSELRAMATAKYHASSSSPSDGARDFREIASPEKITNLARERQRSLEIATQILAGSQLPIFVIDHSDLALSGGAAVRACINERYGLAIDLQFQHRKIVSADEDRSLDSIRELFRGQSGADGGSRRD